MAQGTQRREGAQDNLAGQTVEVTSSRAAPLRVPQVNTPDLMNSTSAKIARGLSQFSSQQFQNAANLQHEASALLGDAVALVVSASRSTVTGSSSVK